MFLTEFARCRGLALKLERDSIFCQRPTIRHGFSACTGLATAGAPIAIPSASIYKEMAAVIAANIVGLFSNDSILLPMSLYRTSPRPLVVSLVYPERRLETVERFVEGNHECNTLPFDKALAKGSRLWRRNKDSSLRSG